MPNDVVLLLKHLWHMVFEVNGTKETFVMDLRNLDGLMGDFVDQRVSGLREDEFVKVATK